MTNDLLKKLKTYGFKTFFYFAYLEIVKRMYWQPIKNSFSQNQEDLKIDEILGYPIKGLYVDIGAYDPDRFSNTKRFYLKGWRGINIEPDEISYKKFVQKRNEDINLNIGIADQEGSLTYYKIDTQTLSTFDAQEAQEYVKQGYQIVEEKKIPVRTLEKVLDENIKTNTEISFMSIDTEGFDMNVLRSNNWNKYKPRIICIESVKHTIHENIDDKKDLNQEDFLTKLNYQKVYDNGLNSIYKLKEQE